MKNIWKKEVSFELLEHLSRNTMVEHLGIKFTEIGNDFLQAEMLVNKNTHQPFGLLHGGASAALAETIGSMAGNLAVSSDRYCVGLEINANHVRPVSTGVVRGIAMPLALGRTIQVWDIKIYNEKEKLVCVARLTLAVREQRAD